MKQKIKLAIHRLRWKLDNADPNEVGFWFCLAGCFFTQVLWFLIG